MLGQQEGQCRCGNKGGKPLPGHLAGKNHRCSERKHSVVPELVGKAPQWAIRSIGWSDDGLEEKHVGKKGGKAVIGGLKLSWTAGEDAPVAPIIARTRAECPTSN